LKSITRRGYATASEAAKARRELIGKLDAGLVKPGATALTVNELLDLYLDGLDADQRLSPKTRHDYRVYAQTYVRKPLDNRKIRDVTPEVILTWQRRLLAEGGAKDGRPLAPNTIRLAQAPLAGAFKLAASSGIVAVNPLMHAPRPKARRSVPRYWSPEQAREFLSLMEGDRTYPVWAFLMCAGLRIGELVALRWSNVDLTEGVVSVVEFSTYLGHDVVPSPGKSRDAIRRVDIDTALAGVLRAQRAQQAKERLAADSYEESGHVFTRRPGSLPSPVPLAAARPLQRGARSTPSDGTRAQAHLRDAHAREWSPSEGRC